MRILVSTLSLVAVLGAGSAARADEEPWRAARTHYERGVELANRGDYKAALDEFNAAYRASPHFAVLYNIGQAEVAMGRPQKAIEVLSKYLRDGKDDVPAPRRQQVTAQLALLQSVFGELSITTDPPGALISIDGAELGRTPLAAPVRLSAGTHVVTAMRPNGQPVTRVVTLAEGQRHVLDLPLPAAQDGIVSLQCWELGVQPYLDDQPVDVARAGLGIAVPAGLHSVSFVGPGRRWPKQPIEVLPGVRAAVVCGTVSPEPPHDKSAPHADETRAFPTGYVLLGSGVVVGGVALGHYLWNAGRSRDWAVNQASIDADDSPGRYARQLENNELAESIDGASVLTVVLSVASGALLVGGSVWLVTDDAGSSPPASAPKNARLPLSVSVARDSATFSVRGAF